MCTPPAVLASRAGPWGVSRGASTRPASGEHAAARRATAASDRRTDRVMSGSAGERGAAATRRRPAGDTLGLQSHVGKAEPSNATYVYARPGPSEEGGNMDGGQKAAEW